MICYRNSLRPLQFIYSPIVRDGVTTQLSHGRVERRRQNIPTSFTSNNLMLLDSNAGQVTINMANRENDLSVSSPLLQNGLALLQPRISYRLNPKPLPLPHIAGLSRHLLSPRPVEIPSLGRRRRPPERASNHVRRPEVQRAQRAVGPQPRHDGRQQRHEEFEHEQPDIPRPAAREVARHGAWVDAEDADARQGRVRVEPPLELGTGGRR